jgi:glycosyltransferase involved in cell wall biosynthesis
MKVAFIENPLTPRYSGVWRYNQMLRHELEKSGVVELTTEATAGREMALFEVDQDGAVKPVNEKVGPARYPWVPMWFKYFVKHIVREGSRKAMHRILGLGWEDFQYLRPPDMPAPNDDQLVHLSDQYLASGISFIRPRPLIITVHDIIPYIAERDFNLNLYERRFHRFLYHLSMRNLHKAKAIIVFSQFTKDSLIEVHPKLADRIHVIYHGVAHDRFTPDSVPNALLENAGLAPDQPYIVHISNEALHKNFRTLLKAFAKVHAERPEVALVKLGRPHHIVYYQETLAFTRSLGIQDAVKFIPNVSDEEVVNWYRGASVLVMPSLVEGFGLPVLEAMACGTPVVTSDAGALVEITGDAAIHVPCMDDDGYASAILKILNNPDVARGLSEKGLEHAKTFTWEDSAKQVIDVYQSVANAR